VSLIFDTGRLGDAKAVKNELNNRAAATKVEKSEVDHVEHVVDAK
jgi:hypothetical protein